MVEYTIGAFNYRSDKLDAFTQLHIVRRVAPVIAPFLMEGGITADLKNPDFRADLGGIMVIMQRSFGILKDDDCDYVIKACLKVTYRMDVNRWVPLWNTNADAMQYNTLDLIDLFKIASQVLMDNLASFSAALVDKLGFPTGEKILDKTTIQ